MKPTRIEAILDEWRVSIRRVERARRACDRAVRHAVQHHTVDRVAEERAALDDAEAAEAEARQRYRDAFEEVERELGLGRRVTSGTGPLRSAPSALHTSLDRSVEPPAARQHAM